MKKLLVVLAAITLVFGFAASAMAADASFSGDFNFGFATMFADDKDAIGWGDLELNFEFMADDYNTIVIETNFEDPIIGVGSMFIIDTAKLDTDLGAFFGLPVGLVHSAGYHEPGGESYPDETTGWEYEDQTKDSIGEATTAIGLEANYDDIAIIDVAFSVAQFDQGDFDAADPTKGGFDAYFGVAAPDIAGMVSAEAYYAVQDSADFKGYFGIDAQAAISMVTAGMSFTYATTDASAWDWIYGIGASAEISIAKLGVSLRGNSNDALDLLGIDANLALTDEFGADAGLALGFFDGAETLQCFEVSVYAKVGTATVRVGYDYTDTTKNVSADADAYKAPAILQDGKGGVFFNVGTEF